MTSSYHLGIVLPERYPVPPEKFCTAIELWTQWFAPQARAHGQVTTFSVPHSELAEGEHDGIENLYIRPGFVDLKLRPWTCKLLRRVGIRRDYWQSLAYFRNYARQVGRRVRRAGVDVVHLHNIAQFAPAIRSQAPDTPIVLDIKWHGLARRGPYYSYPIYRESLARRCLAAIDHVVTPSRFMLREMLALYPQLEGRASYIPNGAEPDLFRPAENGPSSLRDGRIRIAHGGRLTPEKGAQYLLPAFAELAAQHEQVELLMVGKFWTPGARLDGFRRELMEQIDAIGERVHFLGWKDGPALAKVLAQVDLFVHPAEWDEPFAMSTLEAMAAGLPVVATATGGTPEQIEDGVEGLLVPPRDSKALAAAMARLVEDAELRHRMGAAARQRVLDHFTWKHVAAQMDAVYQRLIAR